MMKIETMYLGQPKECWNSRRGFYLQLSKDSSVVESNKDDMMNRARTRDFYYLQFMGINRAINQLGFTAEKLHQCFGKANFKRVSHNGGLSDHTKCVNYNVCGLEIDWDPDNPQTTAATTTATTAGTTAATTTAGPTVSPTIDPSIPDFNNMNYQFSCQG